MSGLVCRNVLAVPARIARDRHESRQARRRTGTLLRLDEATGRKGTSWSRPAGRAVGPQRRSVRCAPDRAPQSTPLSPSLPPQRRSDGIRCRPFGRGHAMSYSRPVGRPRHHTAGGRVRFAVVDGTFKCGPPACGDASWLGADMFRWSSGGFWAGVSGSPARRDPLVPASDDRDRGAHARSPNLQ